MIDIKMPDFNRMEMASTKNCMQLGWSANYYFPSCPQEIGKNSFETYFKNLKIGAVFAYNDDSPKLIVRKVAKGENSSSILVMCEREGIWCERLGFLPWSITEITLENKLFIHSNLGSHFEKDDADKHFASSRVENAGKQFQTITGK
ncbi:hypothetical protein [Legionella maioricensis]|uniref:Uncharacterized protein n=1 Tax=Legionella maioricensis TaxID=2896528 RepID=A0A9X2CY50_9GAMM|nr:hypothetical protein [Legionella maioricensis]MCL9682901.1 hypothetical protein [Legionella maioricensis]MCL9686471.1 hypothetical protein [Legionella maioricensis]